MHADESLRPAQVGGDRGDRDRRGVRCEHARPAPTDGLRARRTNPACCRGPRRSPRRQSRRREDAGPARRCRSADDVATAAARAQLALARRVPRGRRRSCLRVAGVARAVVQPALGVLRRRDLRDAGAHRPTADDRHRAALQFHQLLHRASRDQSPAQPNSHRGSGFSCGITSLARYEPALKREALCRAAGGAPWGEAPKALGGDFNTSPDAAALRASASRRASANPLRPASRHRAAR